MLNHSRQNTMERETPLKILKILAGRGDFIEFCVCYLIWHEQEDKKTIFYGTSSKMHLMCIKPKKSSYSSLVLPKKVGQHLPFFVECKKRGKSQKSTGSAFWGKSLGFLLDLKISVKYGCQKTVFWHRLAKNHSKSFAFPFIQFPFMCIRYRHSAKDLSIWNKND